ncbi:MAG: Mov34/MPN/PAD-1 family protein, partial [Chloroflexota bacterium]
SQTRAGRIAHLPEERETLDYALPPVPRDVMARAVGLFRAVYRLHRTEAAALLLWRGGSFDLAVPDQRVSPVTVKFAISERDLPPGSRLVGTIHSHGGFGAYASSTDEDDDSGLDGLHVVVGDLDRRSTGYAAAVVVDGARFHLPIGRLIERPRRLAEPPADWLERVKVVQAPTRPARKPSMADWTRRAFRPPDNVPKPTRRDLELALERAGRLASSLGYRLETRLAPSEGQAGPEEGPHA